MKMNRHPIYIVDDDVEDNEIIQDVWEQMGLENELIFFTNGKDLIERIKRDEQVPFIIICDVNLPAMDGFEIRAELYKDPITRYKTVPFIFWSNTVSEAQIKKAYDLAAHGMFIKGTTFHELKQTFTEILGYWQRSLKPA
jgi:CheY-like chemotaxis protein